ncbi:hypothetical protein SAMN02745203_00300 [Porphyromonas crevioricanis]|nr:hypothetical protein SAMN02745203_00300 [Porphyromonas crevioricanis]
MHILLQAEIYRKHHTRQASRKRLSDHKWNKKKTPTPIGVRVFSTWV